MKKEIFFKSGIYLIIIFFTVSCKSDFDLRNEKISKVIETYTDSLKVPAYFPDKDVRSYLYEEFIEFYKARDYKLAWVDFYEPLELTDELLEVLDNADAEGLESANYNVEKIESFIDKNYSMVTKKYKRKLRKARKSLNKEVAEKARENDTIRLYNIVHLDFLITSSYLTYASHLLAGRIDPYMDTLWYSQPRKIDLADHLAKSVDSKKIKESLEELLPKHPQYEKLRTELARIRELESKWIKETIPASAKEIEAGRQDSVVRLIKERIALWLKKSASEGYAFDEDLQEDLIMFQRINGLKTTGKIGNETLAALNMPANKLIDQLKVNMERMRWLPEDLGQKHLLVNVPDYHLTIFNKNKKDLEMKVVVGTTYTPTPVFSDTLEYIVFSPTWTVPKNIAVREFLPKLIENSDYLEENNFKLYDSWNKKAEPVNPDKIDWKDVDPEEFNYRIVEPPGQENSLGRIKFMFPNNDDIYLHDTPAGHLFGETNRSFSHGCVRVENPSRLAEYLLKDNKEWNTEKIVEAMQQEEPTSVVLKEKLPIHLVYWTAWIDEDGLLNLRKDPYQHDIMQKKEIKKKEKLLLTSK